MSIFKNLFKQGADVLIGSANEVIDGLTVSDEEKSQAKERLSTVVLSHLSQIFETQVSALKTEMQGNWLQKSWRPLVMLAFTVLLIARWTGIASYEIPLELEMRLMDIIQLGLGGYVVGRSAEKIAKTVTENIDMPFLKKKDRKLF